jgi:hypothetical protein
VDRRDDLALAAQRVAVLAEVLLEGEELHAIEVHARPAQEEQGQDARVRRVAATDREHAIAEVGEGADAGVTAHEDLGGGVAVDVAHRDAEAPAVGAALDAHVRERPVEGDIDVTREQRVDLPLVRREERVLERDAVCAKMLAHHLP